MAVELSVVTLFNIGGYDGAPCNVVTLTVFENVPLPAPLNAAMAHKYGVKGIKGVTVYDCTVASFTIM